MNKIFSGYCLGAVLVVLLCISKGECRRLSNQIKSIPGTNLYTGIDYAVTLKSKGSLTWSFNKVDDKYNYLQIVFGETEKVDYKEGKRFYKDTVWRLLESEKPGRYELVNVDMPDAAITWAGKSPSGKFAVAHLGHANDPNYQERGVNRDDVLWRLELENSDPEMKFYRIYNNRFPGNGILTWANKDNGDPDKKFCQIYDQGSPDAYKLNGDYLWKFTPVIKQRSKIPTIPRVQQ